MLSLLLSTMLLLSTVILPTVLLLTTMACLSAVATTAMLSRLHRLTTLEINIYSSRILFRPILQPQLSTDFFDLGLDLLHMACGMVSLAHNGV